MLQKAITHALKLSEISYWIQRTAFALTNLALF